MNASLCICACVLHFLMSAEEQWLSKCGVSVVEDVNIWCYSGAPLFFFPSGMSAVSDLAPKVPHCPIIGEERDNKFFLTLLDQNKTLCSSCKWFGVAMVTVFASRDHALKILHMHYHIQ